MKQWSVKGKTDGFDELVYEDVPVPKISENEVLVKMKAASLNYRDLIIPKVWSSTSSGQHMKIHSLSFEFSFLHIREYTPSLSTSQ